jgi:hypothetical protein
MGSEGKDGAPKPLLRRAVKKFPECCYYTVMLGRTATRRHACANTHTLSPAILLLLEAPAEVSFGNLPEFGRRIPFDAPPPHCGHPFFRHFVMAVRHRSALGLTNPLALPLPGSSLSINAKLWHPLVHILEPDRSNPYHPNPISPRCILI